MSLFAITCPDTWMPIELQHVILGNALRSILYGQPVYGNAAITGRVQDRSGKLIGQVVSNIFPDPATVRQEWPSRVLSVPVPDSQGMRLRVESMGPALDNWDRGWFLFLCKEGKAEILRDRNLHDPLAPFRLVYQIQGSQFRFNPFGPLAQRPTWAAFVKVIDTLRDLVFLPYVAHDLQYSIVDGHGMPLGVGYFEAYKEPDQNEPDQNAVTLANQRNSTGGGTSNV
ncbi:MAG: hypothetical protein Q9195_008903 [Heterodermia aff. obscurata]